MSFTFVKIIAGGMLAFSSFCVQAGSLSDTSSILLASAKAESCTEVYKANVIFPEIFEEDADKVTNYIRNFSITRRDYIIRMHQKSKSYFPRIIKIFDNHEVPKEFRVLMVLESACTPNVVSKAGAVGYWQFMDAPAKEYGLKIVPKQKAGKRVASRYVKNSKGKTIRIADDRTNFVKSTNAAAKYLQDRSKNLNNDWLLIAASYNWGVGNVWTAMKRTGLETPTYWDIEKYVPAETKAYVLNFITLNVIFNNYDAFIKNELRFEDKEVEKLMMPVYNPMVGDVM